MPQIELPLCWCWRCKHQWSPDAPRDQLDDLAFGTPRILIPAPRICPKCKSPYWDVPRRAGK